MPWFPFDFASFVGPLPPLSTSFPPPPPPAGSLPRIFPILTCPLGVPRENASGCSFIDPSRVFLCGWIGVEPTFLFYISFPQSSTPLQKNGVLVGESAYRSISQPSFLCRLSLSNHPTECDKFIYPFPMVSISFSTAPFFWAFRMFNRAVLPLTPLF